MILHDIQAAAAILAEGGIVAFPTETVYGLGADALNPAAVAKVFALKGRPAHNPLIVHVSSIDMARALTFDWPAHADTLARALWPGPLTLVLPKAAHIPSAVTAGADTVAIRMPAHELALELITALGRPIVGPSANASGSISPTTAAHVLASLGDRIPVLDGGPCATGIESTVVRVEPEGASVLRPGVIGPADIARLVPLIDAAPLSPSAPLPSPGLLTRHYAPRTPTRLISAADTAAELAEHPTAALLAITPTNRPLTIPMPADPAHYARRLYAALREADAMNAPVILVERPTAIGPIWDAVRDRLARASASD